MNAEINFTQVNRDINGNPRFVCHFLVFNKPGENITYEQAIKRANKIGGRKFHNK